MNWRLMRREKAGADPCAGGAERKRRDKPATVRDPAGSKNREPATRINDGRDEANAPRFMDMTAGLPSLRHDHIHAVISHTPGVNGRRNCVHHLCAAAMRSFDQFLTCSAPEKGDCIDPFSERYRQPLLLRLGEDEVHPEWPSCQRSCRSNLIANGLRCAPSEREHAEAACIAHRRRKCSRSRTAHGLLDVGRSMASSSATSCPCAFFHLETPALLQSSSQTIKLCRR